MVNREIQARPASLGGLVLKDTQAQMESSTFQNQDFPENMVIQVRFRQG